MNGALNELGNGATKLGKLEELLARMLHYGSWLASAAIGVGLVLALIDLRFGTRELAAVPNLRIATAGILLFISLPALRVLLMLLVFVRERDYRMAITAALVLLIIACGIVLGIRSSSGRVE